MDTKTTKSSTGVLMYYINLLSRQEQKISISQVTASQDTTPNKQQKECYKKYIKNPPPHSSLSTDLKNATSPAHTHKNLLTPQ